MKEFSYEEKLDYHSRRSRGNNASYSRDWLTGASYAEALTDNGNKLHKAKGDEYIKQLSLDSKRREKNKGFLNGFNSFVSDCEKIIKSRKRR